MSAVRSPPGLRRRVQRLFERRRRRPQPPDQEHHPHRRRDDQQRDEEQPDDQLDRRRLDRLDRRQSVIRPRCPDRPRRRRAATRAVRLTSDGIRRSLMEGCWTDCSGRPRRCQTSGPLSPVLRERVRAPLPRSCSRSDHEGFSFQQALHRTVAAVQSLGVDAWGAACCPTPWRSRSGPTSLRAARCRR